MVRHGYWAVHTVCGSGPTTKGIDVSKWQTTVDWAKVAADGVKFGVARTSDGTTYDDAYFTANWKGMKNNGIIRGAYQFFRPDQDPVAQAKFMISKLNKAGGLQAGDLPPVLDLEKNGGLSASNVVKAVDKWIAYIQQNTGRRPIIYTGSYFWDASAATTKYKSYPLWTAHYTTKTCPLVPNAWSKWAIWQYTSSGKVNGVSGNCDMNRFNGTVSDIKALAAKSVINPPKPDQGVPKPDKFVPKPDKFVPKVDKFVPKPDLKKPPKLDAKVSPKDLPKPKKDIGKGPRLDAAKPPPPGLNSTLTGGCSVAHGGGNSSLFILFLTLMVLFKRRPSPASPKVYYYRYYKFHYANNKLWFIARDAATTTQYYLFSAPLDCSAKATKVTLPTVGGAAPVNLDSYMRQSDDGRYLRVSTVDGSSTKILEPVGAYGSVVAVYK